MKEYDSGTIGRAETRAAKEAERRHHAAIVWAEVEAKREVVEERTARLRAARLARDAREQD